MYVYKGGAPCTCVRTLALIEVAVYIVGMLGVV